MKIPRCLIGCAALAALFVTGCVNVQVGTEGQELVSVTNDGIFLFCAIPICTGDPNYPNEQVANWFTNTVTVATNMRVLEEEAAARGAHDVKDVVSYMTEEKMLWFILKRKTYHTSAQLVK